MLTALACPGRSTSCSSYQPAGWTYQPSRSSSDRRYVLESGGRPKGTPGSRLISVSRPRYPSCRRVTAALPPAMPPPTITIGSPPVLSATGYICPAGSGGQPPPPAATPPPPCSPPRPRGWGCPLSSNPP